VLLTDLDLIVALPYTIVSALAVTANDLFFRIVRLPMDPLYVWFSKANLSLVWSLVLFPLWIAAASLLTTLQGSFSLASLAGGLAVFLVGGTLLGKILAQYFHIEDVHDRVRTAGGVSKRESEGFKKIKNDGRALPRSCVRHEYDRMPLYIAWIKTMLMVPAFVVAVVLPPSWLDYALILYLALFLFNDFERIEHIASHSLHGKLLIGPAAPWWARVAELLRRYVAWPLFGWYPNAYLVTHALHHHAENNGPADWQSTVRYDRTSFLDFAKAALWLGLNTAIPIDTVSYLIQKRRWRPLRVLLLGYAWYVALLALVALLEPALFFILAGQRVLFGASNYRFVGVWHGFHDPQHAYDVQAANQHLSHYAHHVRPSIHLLDDAGTYRKTQEIKRPSPLVLLRPEFGLNRGFWFLQALLWKKEFARAGDCLVEHDTVSPADKGGPFSLRRDLVERGVGATRMQQLSARFITFRRSSTLQRFDDWISRKAGDLMYQMNSPRRPKPRTAATALR
jgi:hypothetical protein